MWTKLYGKIPMDHLYYYSPQFTREHYLMCPGIDGSQFFDLHKACGLDQVPNFTAGALEDIAVRIGRPLEELDICYMKDGPYGVPLP